MTDNQVRTVDKDIQTGLWQNNLDGSFIKVRSVGLTVISYNDEGCNGVYNMGVSVLLDNYRLYAADKPAPVVDDTFNDDTEAQTFSDLGRAMILERAKELPTHIRDRILVELNASAPKSRKHAHYFKNISDFDEMDTYLFCRVWKVKDDSGALHHALKKLMDAGKRGNKDKIKDVAEARDTLNRYLEIEAMFTEVSA